ncbi:hypothetical protein AC578_7314 [Pseudocercospora eumusae]|uniref:Uncharacterized protein n=1 Tax=Pseudocercospora eumusae TaxID=321146 RepID=A0A139HWU9_9PEZI|nr:hypothetical protein AC578_7314 [Pseudocercospora eumusae]
MQLLAICAFVAAVTANPTPLVAREDQIQQEMDQINSANQKLFAQSPELKDVFHEVQAKAQAQQAAVLLAADGQAEKNADCDGISLGDLCVSAAALNTTAAAAAVTPANSSSTTSTSSTSSTSSSSSADTVKGPPYWLFSYLNRPAVAGYPSACTPYNPYACYGYYPWGGSYSVTPYNYGPGPGNGKTSCGDLADSAKGFGYICNSEHNELDYCYKGYGSDNIYGGSFTVQKCGFYGGCGTSDDGKTGLCYY